MAKIITTLHPEGQKKDELYPNILPENIPDNSITSNKLIDELLTGTPKYVGTSSDILTLSENKGVAVATDNGYWYYWDGKQYVSSGKLYQATLLADDYVKLININEDAILGLGYSLIDINYNIGTLNTSTGAIESNNNYLYTDLISSKSLLYLRRILAVDSSNNIDIVCFKYNKNDNSFIGWSDLFNCLEQGNDKVFNVGEVNIRLRFNFTNLRDFTNTSYYNFVTSRFKLYMYNNYYYDNIDSKFLTINDKLKNNDIIYNRPNSFKKESYYIPEKRYDYNTILKSRIDINISRNGSKWGTDFNIKQHIIQRENGVTVYLSPNGSDDNDGLTLNNPKLTLESALSVNNVLTIILESGIYYQGVNFTSGLIINQDVNIICNGYCYFSSGDKITYTDLGNNYYLIPNGVTGSPRMFIDLETMKDLTFVNSTANMDFYTFYRGSSGCIVKLPYEPTNDRIVRTTNTNPIQISSNCYLEGICFLGFYQGLNIISDDKNVYINECKFLYSRNNGLRVLGSNVYCYRCEASYNYLDGFNYHVNNTYVPCSLEIECEAKYNGYLNVDDTSYSNNGSTTHYGGKAIRLNCNYSLCKGGVIADHTAMSFNFGCVSYCSTCYVENVPYNNTSIECISSSIMYLLDCALYGSKYQLSMVESNGIINTNIEYVSIYKQDNTETINIIE